jgi:hypothetical protein
VAKPKIGYQNLLELSTSTITVTDETSGFEKALAYNWKTFDGWKPQSAGTVYYTVDLGSAMSVDYWASAKHTLGTNGGSIKLQYSSDNFSADTNDFAAALSPSDDTVMFQTVSTAISARYWRWEITSTPVSFFAVLALGEALELVRAVKSGFMLPHEARSNKVLDQKSEGGAFLGRSIINKGIKAMMRFDTLPLDFGRSDWSAFLDHAELKPFFFSWNPDYQDTVYAWLDRDPTPTAYDRINTIRVGIRIRGLK